MTQLKLNSRTVINLSQRNRRRAVQSPYAEQVSYYFIFFWKRLTSFIETYVELNSDGQLLAVSPNLIEYTTPKPTRKKGKVPESDDSNLQVESEDNSQIEIEDHHSQIDNENGVSQSENSDTESESEDNFETPKALRLKVARSDNDFEEMADGDRAEVDYATESDQHGKNSEHEVDTYTQPKKSKQRSSSKESNALKSIDLAKVQKTAARKDKRAFRKEVEARRVVVKEERHKACYRYLSQFGSCLDVAK